MNREEIINNLKKEVYDIKIEYDTRKINLRYSTREGKKWFYLNFAETLTENSKRKKLKK